jgi:hypothetical protein
MPRRLRRIALALALVSGLIVACATGSQDRAAAKYPPRRPGCALLIFRGDTPELSVWDDLGLVETICHIDETESTCYGRMRAEACRMGGDIVYHLPRKPWRPKDEAMGFRGKVAHTRHVAAKEEVHADPASAFPPPASAEESAGPVIPLTGPGAPGAAALAAAVDAGGRGAPPPPPPPTTARNPATAAGSAADGRPAPRQ